MRTTTAWVAGQDSRRPVRDDPAGSLRRGELAAGLAAAALICQLIFAPVTVMIAATLVAVGRFSRWRPAWLLAPAVAGLIWLFQAGTARAAAGFASSSRQLSGYLLAVAVHPARLGQPGAFFAGAAARLPGQLPLALMVAAGEAALVLWLGWWRTWASATCAFGTGAVRTGAVASGVGAATRQGFRPGLVALARRRVSAAALSGGRTLTAEGCALGLQISTGELAGFSWSAAENGVLLTGAQRADLDQLGLAAVCAALRIRKTVLVADLSGAGLGAQVTALARRLGVAASEIAAVTVGDLGTVDSLVGRAIRRRGVVAISAGTGDGLGQVIDDLTGVLAGLGDLGLRTDCLVWISGCESVDDDCLAELVCLGPQTGTAVLLSTTSTYARLTAAVGTIVATGPISAELAGDLSTATAAHPTGRRAPRDAIREIPRTQPPGMFTILAATQPGAGQSRATPHCRAVPIAPGDVR